jgi:hypothetical protein
MLVAWTSEMVFGARAGGAPGSAGVQRDASQIRE